MKKSILRYRSPRPSGQAGQVFQSKNAEETEVFGERIATQLLGKKIFLFGDLGVGKTTFLRGMARGLRMRSKIKSPTFVGEHVHKVPNRGNLIHLDLYRAESLEVEKTERLQELFSSDDTVVVEWSECLPKILLPKKRVELKFQELKSGTREIMVLHAD